LYVHQLIEGWKGEGEFAYTVIRFVSTGAKYFGTCIIVSVNGTPVEDKMRRFKGDCAHFNINKCPIYTHGDATAKINTNYAKRITVWGGIICLCDDWQGEQEHSVHNHRLMVSFTKLDHS
jgi:hypothetical protein